LDFLFLTACGVYLKFLPNLRCRAKSHSTAEAVINANIAAKVAVMLGMPVGGTVMQRQSTQGQ
jgi:hypothetical protein